MYNIGICDDGKNICISIENMILQYTNNKNIVADIFVWYTGEKLCSYLKQGNHIDILFLDIELLKQSGMEVGDFIRNTLEDRQMQIIYISARSSYAQKLFKTQPLDFLVKPIVQSQVNEVLELAVKILKKNTEKFKFKYGQDYFYVPYGEICYFASEGRKVKIFTVKGQEEFYGKLKNIIEKLPENFIMIHQSYIVNKEFITRYTYEMVTILDGTKLDISKANRKMVREILLKEV